MNTIIQVVLFSFAEVFERKQNKVYTFLSDIKWNYRVKPIEKVHLALAFMKPVSFHLVPQYLFELFP